MVVEPGGSFFKKGGQNLVKVLAICHLLANYTSNQHTAIYHKTVEEK